MTLIRSLRHWLRQIFHRPADLLEFFSGAGTLGYVLISAYYSLSSQAPPALRLMGQIAPQWAWLLMFGLAACLQLAALWLDNPDDDRHPLWQVTKWARMVAALLVAAWFAIVSIALAEEVGTVDIHALYATFLVMNLYTTAHVLTRDGP